MQKFNYHSHTYRCGHADLNISDEDYVLEYIKMKFKKIAFTDHCPEKEIIDKRTNMRMDYNQRKEYLNSIKMLKDKYSNYIDIEAGYEIEYLPDQIDNLRDLKDETDKLILGQHFIYDKNKNLKIIGKDILNDEDLFKYAMYISDAIKLGLPNIIAHPDLFMLKGRTFEKTEAEITHIICKNAEKYNVPLEINLKNIFCNTYYKNGVLNNDSIENQRKQLFLVEYPNREFWKIVSDYNIRVIYGIDTHHKGHISLYKELVELAHEVIGEDIIDKLNFVEDDI